MNVVLGKMTIGEALELLSREVEVIDPWAGYPPHWSFGNRKIKLPNGWVVSVGFGMGHDCANYGPFDPSLLDDLTLSPDCEVALFTPDDQWFSPHSSDGRQVWGRVSASDFLRIVDAVAAYRDGGPCPCPDCVLGRIA